MTDHRLKFLPEDSAPELLSLLIQALRGPVVPGQQRVSRAALSVQVWTYCQIGRRIVELGQGGVLRPENGARLLPQLAEKLRGEFGRGFGASNLHKMKQFYLTCPILAALRPELSWTHYRLLLRVDALVARQLYLYATAASQNRSYR